MDLEYQSDSDTSAYQSPMRSRFDVPGFAVVFGDTLRRPLLLRGTRPALKRKGFQPDVRALANSTSEERIQALTASAGRPGA